MQGVVREFAAECHRDCGGGIWVVRTKGRQMLRIAQPGVSTRRSCGRCPLTASPRSHSG